MPPAARRAARRKRLLRLYLAFARQKLARARRRHALFQRYRSMAGYRAFVADEASSDLFSVSSLGSFSDNSFSESSSSTWESNSDSDTWQDTMSTRLSDSDNFSGMSDADMESCEDLVLMETDSGSENDLDEDDCRADALLLQQRTRLRAWVHQQLSQMYSQRYEVPRNQLPRPQQSFLRHLLFTLKQSRDDQFREELRITPATFDALVEKIQFDPVFANDAHTSQMPVEEQLAITLWRFGHDGNAASLQKVANWAGVGKGTVSLVTRRVMTAILRPVFMNEAVCIPTADEKEEAKVWVHRHSCRAWRNGWCFVDGTLVRLFNRPNWYGESYFDRKCNYSLNFQIISLPNLRIIDYGFGHVGSTHDATAWRGTRLYQEHDELFNDGEWVWADSAYPINDWVVAPYKKPDRDLPDNERFNTTLSGLRIRSEHAIGFLKGRFQSLKGLRVHIKSKTRHIFATYWVAACIGLHSFAMLCEDREKATNDDMTPIEDHPFVRQGLSDSESSDSDVTDRARQGQARAPQMQALLVSDTAAC